MKRKIKSDGSVYAVILVGGKGKRLRPLSTASRPKAFLSFDREKKTMFAATLERIRKMVPSENIVVVANALHSRLVRKDFPDIRRENLLLEPASLNTAPAIIFAASVLKKRKIDAIMAVLPSDQYVRDKGEYLDSIKDGIAFIKKNRASLLALAVEPTFPSTGFGYIKIGPKARRTVSRHDIYRAEEFVEKPDLKRASGFIEEGIYLWNAGAFIFSASSILAATAEHAPKIFRAFADFDGTARAYKALPDISIDYAVMEKAKNLYCLKGKYDWMDMGDFASLKEILNLERRDFLARGDKVVKIL